MQICVIGAGILGLTIAYELSTRGHDVLVLEKDSPFAGASHRSFAWINANNKQPASYHRLNELGVEEHTRFQEQFPSDAVWLSMSGNILADFSEHRATTYEHRMKQAQNDDYPVEWLDRDSLVKSEPAIVWPEDFDGAIFFPKEGYLDNDILARELLTALKVRGVEIQQATVERVDSSAAQVTVTHDQGVENFDQVVIAAGAGSRVLGENSGFHIPVADPSIPSARTHSLLGLTEVTDIGLSHVVISNRINVRPRHDGRMWVQVPYVEDRVEEGGSAELLQEVGAVMESELKTLFVADVAVEEVIFSARSFPEDGVSIMGYLDPEQRVYAAVTHSGMTLAALFARLTSEELTGEQSPLLVDFRPSRFANGVSVVEQQDFIGKQ